MFGFFKRKAPANRKAALGDRAEPGPLKDFYAKDTPAGDNSLLDVPFVALDLETTGLDPQKHDIVSMGWVLIERGNIQYRTAGHQLVRPTGLNHGQSVTVHGIFDDHLMDAPDIVTALGQLLPVLAGRVMIAHHASTEFGFLNQACRRYFGASFTMPVVDTLDLGRRMLKQQKIKPETGGLRLFNLRRRFGLPAYPAHHAFFDALASAELFQAEVAYLKKPAKDLTLRDVLAPS